MKWSPPLVGLIRAAVRNSPSMIFADTITVVLALPFVAGCKALPAMQSAPVHVAMNEASDSDGYTDAEKLRLSQLPTIPDFDLPAAFSASAVEQHGVRAPVISQKPLTKAKVFGPAEAYPPVAGAAGQLAEASGQRKPGAPDTAEVNPPGAATARSSKTAIDVTKAPSAAQIPSLRIDAPKPFAWTPIGRSTGNRSFQSVSIGDEGYRAIVIGSVAGDDSLAIELVEQLARKLQSENAILGGFQSTVIRTLNPDGEALNKVFNEKGQYINHGFPKDNGVADTNQPEEVSFLLSQIQTVQPQRLIHVRTIESEKGIIAASSGCMSVANDVAGWLNFRVISLPETAVSGSLERHLSTSRQCEVLTFAIPATAKKSELWDHYGDALQNLLMGGDVTARELAREKNRKSSASSRNVDGK
jgi:hypothetical protein